MTRHDNCPVCNSENIRFLFRCSDRLVSGEEFDIYSCPDCGFCLTHDHPDENSIMKYYESDEYVSHNDDAKGIINRIYLFSRNIMLRRKKSITEKASGVRQGQLLDIGCGTGYFAGTMKKAGWGVTGIEPGEKAGKSAALKFGLEIIKPGRISSLPGNSFDCITLWHVLEHFHDPLKYYKEIFRLLKPGGVCIVALPNSSSSDAGFYRNSWAAWDVPRHLWHFNPSSFKKFSDLNGFKTTNIIRLPLDVFYISILSEKAKGSGMAFLKGVLRGCWFYLHSLHDISKSSSLIYILRKK